jgi:hypothetical protein
MWFSEFQNASAVWPDSVRPEASVIVPEIITGQRRPAHVEELLDGEQRRLGVQRVEHGFDQQDVGAAFDQALDRFEVMVDQRFESDVAVAGVVDVRRDRRGAAGRAKHAGDEARLGRIGGGEFVAQHAGEAGAFEIQLIDQLGPACNRPATPRWN